MRLTISNVLAALGVLALAGCATSSQPSTLTGDYLSGRFAARANAVDAAAAAYAKAHRDSPQQVGLLKHAFFFNLAAGDVEKAAPYAREILSIAPDQDDGLARIALAAHMLKRGQARQARSVLAGEMQAPFTKSIAFLVNVWIEDSLYGPAAAIAMLDNPGTEVFDGFSPLHRAFLLERAGRKEEAHAAYQAAVSGLGGPVGREAYGAFLERAGDFDSALAFYDLLAEGPGPARRAAEAARGRAARGAASAAYARVAPAQGAAIALYSFAGVLIEQAAGHRARAAEAGFVLDDPHYNLPLGLARLALYLDPRFDDARRLVGQILNIYGDFDAARAMLAEIPPASPLYEQARIDMAAGLAASGEAAQAIAVLKDAIKKDPRSVEMRWTLSNVYAGEERPADSVRVLDGVIDTLGETPPEDAWRYYVSRGAAYLELDRWSEAEVDLQRAVEIAPEEPTALNYLGYSWAERGLNLAEAFDLIEKAVALQPNSGAIIDSLGWAHYQLGEYDQAVGHLEKAAALEPSDPTITDHLGDVYWRLGRVTEARFQWRRALDLEPAEKQRADLNRKLERGLDVDSSGARGER